MNFQQLSEFYCANGFNSSLGIQKVRTVFTVLTSSIPAWLTTIEEVITIIKQDLTTF
jgi:hypothetical protein